MSEKTAFSGKVSYFADKFMGASHDFKFGVQYNSGGSDYVLGPNDYIYTYGSEPAYGYTQLPYHQGGRMRNVGVFVDDTIRIGSRLSVNAGLRYDYSKAYFPEFGILDREGNETGEFTEAVDEVFHWNTISPRLGFNWKITGDGRTVLKAHAGRYYRGVVTGEFDNTSPSITPRYLFSGTYDAQGNPEGLELVSDNTNLRVDPNFKPPYTDQFTIGIERELTKTLGLSVNYVYKKGERYGGNQDIGGQYEPAVYIDSEGEGATGAAIPVQAYVGGDRVFQLTNPDGMFSRFHGVTVQLIKRMADNWQMTSSFVWGDSTGRLGSNRPSTSATFGPAGSQTSTAGLFGRNPNDFVNTEGRSSRIGRSPSRPSSSTSSRPGSWPAPTSPTRMDGRSAAWCASATSSGSRPPSMRSRSIAAARCRARPSSTCACRRSSSWAAPQTWPSLPMSSTRSTTTPTRTCRTGWAPRTTSALPTEFIPPRRVMLGAKLRF